MRFREGVLFLLAVGLLGSTAAAAEDLEIVGAGATFPQPLYSKWFAEYRKDNPNVAFQYQPIGSGSGLKKLTSHSVFFAASDAPLTPAQVEEGGGGILHFPTTIGAVVVIDNVAQAPSELRLSPAVLADIFLGTVSK